jgi:hypothetical protein
MTMTASTGSTEKPKVEAPSGKAENTSSLPEDKRPPGDLRRRVGKAQRKGPFVKYVGSAAVRKITGPQWRSLGIELKDSNAEHNWGIANDKIVEASNFSDEQLDYLLIDDLQQGSGAHAFLLVDYDDDGQLVQAVYE